MRIRTQYPVTISVRFDKRDFELEGICGLTTYDADKARITIDIGTEYGLEYATHEIIHALDFIEERIDSKLDTESKAYLAQLMFSRIMKEYARLKREKRETLKNTK